jgi:serine phosphatase RsbU (regulator of sigma subunit)
MSADAVDTLISNDRMARALYALLELSKALGSEVDLDALLSAIVENASAVIEADRTSIFVYDPIREILWSRVAQGLETSTIQLPLGTGIAGEVARTRSLVNLADVYDDPRFNPAVDQRTGYRTRSMICVPVMGRSGDLLGVIQSVNKTTAARFDERDESLMRAIASHVGVAFERARLTEVYLDKERMEQALRLASEIQMRMLPGQDTAPADPAVALRAQLRPAREVGGDLYDYFLDGRRLHFCIGDVSGKGIGAALVMAVTKTLFRANAAMQPDPGAVLSSMSNRLYEETDPWMFVTAFCATLDLDSGLLRYSGAGHDRPFVLSTDGGIAPLDVRPGLALGVFPSFVYKVSEITLAPGESLFLYTDGVTEATSPDEQLLGLDAVVEGIRKAEKRTPDEVVNAILRTVDEFAGGGPQSDDITIMCVQYRGQAAAND